MKVTYKGLIDIVSNEGLDVAAEKVSHVSLGLFEPLDFSKLAFTLKNIDTKPFFATLQNVPLAVENYDSFALNSQSLSLDDPLNTHYPGEFSTGGAFLIESLINNVELKFKASGYVNDVFTKQDLKIGITSDDFKYAEIVIDIPAQNSFKAFINSADHLKFTQNGVVKNNMLAINYRSSGVIQLIYDLREHISEVCIGGTKGNILIPPDGNVRITGNFLNMDTLYISALSLKGYGVYLAVGLGVLIEVHNNKEVISQIIANEDRLYDVIDIVTKEKISSISFKMLKQPEVELNGKNLKTGSLTSIYMSQKVAERMI